MGRRSVVHRVRPEEQSSLHCRTHALAPPACFAEAFGRRRIMYGGPDEQSLANIVHSNAEWRTATKLRPGLYTGGLRYAYDHGEGDKQEEQVLFVVGKKCKWGTEHAGGVQTSGILPFW